MGRYLSDEGLVLFHQLIQVLLVLLHPLQEVHLLMLQQSKLLIYLEDRNRVFQRVHSVPVELLFNDLGTPQGPIHILTGEPSHPCTDGTV